MREYTSVALRTVLKGAQNPDDQARLLHASLPYVPPQKLPDVAMNAKGMPLPNQKSTKMNVLTIAREYGVEIRHNVMMRQTEYRFENETFNILAPESSDVRRAVVDGCLRVGLPINLLDTVLDELGLKRPYHPMATWMAGCAWDGLDRFEDVLATVKVRREQEFLWAVYLKRWLIQVVQAVHGWAHPQQMSSALVLQGDQRTFKSLWVGSLVPAPYFSGGISLHLGGYQEKDSIMRATSTPIVELGELDTTFSASDMGALKAFMANAYDQYRIPGAHGGGRRYPRTTVYAATVNRMDFLTDATGSRRFWPVEALGCVVNHGIDLQQLWAQVRTWWAAGEKWWLTEDEEVARIEESVRFRYTPPAGELAEKHFAEHSADDIGVMNATMFCRDALALPANASNVRAVRDVITAKLGPSKRIKAMQNAWNIPMRYTRHAHLVSAVQQGEKS